jgi:hypothetical protein
LLKNQNNSLILEWISRQIGRWGGSSRVNEGIGVNRPSVIALRPDHERQNSRHTQPCRQIGKGGNVVEEKRREVRTTGITKETGETLETQGVINTRRRRVTFVLDYFPASREGE